MWSVQTGFKERRLPAVEGNDGWEAVTPCAPAVMPPSTRLAKSIAPELRLQRLPLLRSDANRSSKAFPICIRPVARVKAPTQDAKPGFPRDSPTVGDRRWLPKNIEGRNSSDPAPRHRYRPIFAPEIANRRGAISKDQCADCKARDSFRALKNRVCTVKTPRDHLARVSASMSPLHLVTRMAPAIQRDLCESHHGRLHRRRPQKIEKDWTRRIPGLETAMVSTVRAEEAR